MADFAESVDMVLRAEGGYVDDDPIDNGGATNFGVSLSFFDILSGMNAEDSRRIAPLVGSCFNDIYPEVMTWFSSQLSHRGTFTNLDQPMSPRIHNISTSLTSCLPGSSPLGDCNVY